MDINFEKEIESITTQIIEKYEPEKIILFGSAAGGESWSELIESENSAVSLTEISLLTSLSTDLKNSRKGVEMGNPFLKAIIKEGKVLYG